jgi:hypothetical protein
MNVSVYEEEGIYGARVETDRKQRSRQQSGVKRLKKGAHTHTHCMAAGTIKARRARGSYLVHTRLFVSFNGYFHCTLL